jgi:hypothetical protein
MGLNEVAPNSSVRICEIESAYLTEEPAMSRQKASLGDGYDLGIPLTRPMDSLNLSTLREDAWILQFICLSASRNEPQQCMKSFLVGLSRRD